MEQQDPTQLNQPLQPQQPVNNPLQPTPNTIPFHRHNGKDAPKINAHDLLGSPTTLQTISVADATVAPTYNSQEGTVIIQYDGTNYVEWTRINSTWKGISLTVLPTGLAGTFTYYVASTSGGSPTVKLTFKNGILTNNT